MSADRRRRLPVGVVQLVGWPSVALGVVAVARPRTLASMLGLDPEAGSRAIRAAGWRELVVLTAFLAWPVPRSLWWFVGQDVCDISLGAAALRCDAQLVDSPKRLRVGLIGYGLLALADTGIALRYGRKSGD